MYIEESITMCTVTYNGSPVTATRGCQLELQCRNGGHTCDIDLDARRHKLNFSTSHSKMPIVGLVSL